MKFATAALALAVGLAAWPALADPMPTGLDANRDGRINQPEFVAFSRQRNLGRGDTNHDGRISKDEARAQIGGAQAMMLDLFWGRVDTDHDGYLSPAELERSSAERFAKLDGDHNGYLDATEQAQIQTRR